MYVLDHGVQPLGIPIIGLLALDGVLGPENAVVVSGLFALAVTAFIGLRWRGLWRLA